MKTITPVALDHLLTKEPALTILDVRTPMEFAEVHVPQAHNVPLDQFDPADFRTSPQPIYLLCKGGGRATKAAEKCSKAGIDNTVVIEGGTQAWIEAGLPVERSAVKVISLERQVRIAAGSLVLTGLILAWLVHPYFIILSAFVGTGLIFAGVTDWCGMGLLLAKMPWNKKS